MGYKKNLKMKFTISVLLGLTSAIRFESMTN